MREAFALTLVFILLVSVSGCLSDACKEVEKEMANQNITCRCSGSDVGNVFPEEAKNATEGEKCYCICIKDGISIKAITPRPNSTVGSIFIP